MARRTIRSISVPITLAVVAVSLSIALLIGWTFVITQNVALTSEVSGNIWLLSLGIVSFIVIMSVLVLFSVFLAREILEVRRQDSFIDSVTHELKSPLASLKLCLQTLDRPQINDEQRAQLRTMMVDDIDRLAAFIDDVLQASRLTHDRTGVALGDVDLEELARYCAETVVSRHRVDTSRISLQIESGLRLYTDRAALEIVLKNLIDNAIKYTPGDAPVVVVARREPSGEATIEVKDRGIGIPKRDLRRVFQRFYRVPEAPVRAKRGTGLGLFVVSALVRNLGGDVRASSTGPNEGTVMRVTLPAQVAS